MAITRITKGVIEPNENYDTHNIVSTGIITSVGADINGDLDVDGHTNLDNVSISGVTTFSGSVNNLVLSGVVTTTGLDVNGNADISGNLSVGGVLTYEDVTSIDSVGIITAQSDIHVGAGVSAVGVGTFGSLDIGGDIDVDGHTNLDNVSIAGVSTFSNSLFLPDDQQVKLGNTAASPDFKIYHNTVANTTSPPNYLYPNSNYIDSVASQNLFIRTLTAGIYLGRTDGEHAASFHTNGSAVLYHNASGGGGEKFRTTAKMTCKHFRTTAKMTCKHFCTLAKMSLNDLSKIFALRQN